MGLDMHLIKREKECKRELWDFDEEMIYWRKANAIHKFLCDNGEEITEQIIYKVSKTNLEDLLDKCKEVLEKAVLEKGKIQNGKRLTKEGWQPILEDGDTIVNEEEISDILPTCEGFFFGSTDYDQYYLSDILKTKEELEKILPTIDFEKDDVYYLASW